MGDRPPRLASPRLAPPLLIAPLHLAGLPGGVRAPVPAWHHAHVTMRDACRLLIGRVGAPGARTGSAAFRREIALRWAGNGLKELDRFLCVLLDACAPAAGMPAAQMEAFERSHDTARKLRRVERLLDRDGAETPRLQAIGRLRRMACAERDGTPHSALAMDLAIATAGAAGAERPGHDGAIAPPILSNETLATIAQFYQSIADRLAADCAARADPLDFSSTIPDIRRANVACDGI